ncbi:hypothetical protein J3Q64DRAFT_1746757 [Phycomyces blakesleeanus]|uniref:Retrotransposon gag domain-containing protein n=2 Tax=Phycomyces blakesleeanus TaxID=4837 RepID=A0A167MAU5_PHYB8|nr:hypothetical protein PHYBLDRAFT_65646 [Phycomyces blakesleeanus NRRL 1555(-)]OAD72307.1 hypothetical protein PHYBLDRAFT_65646 [Phycomyces blakesleeanus NRRL 1555(-)]|eukprot:XP_018290347.1 hypothetical protein PHYBLDRAFT_65646 [Phycomyces blakesleeanus NRRL 1555(-)]
MNKDLSMLNGVISTKNSLTAIQESVEIKDYQSVGEETKNTKSLKHCIFPGEARQNFLINKREDAIRVNNRLSLEPLVFSSYGCSVESWIRRMKLYIHFNNFSKEDALHIIPAHLEGKALLWYDAYALKNKYDTPEKIYDGLLRQFSYVDVLQKYGIKK